MTTFTPPEPDDSAGNQHIWEGEPGGGTDWRTIIVLGALLTLCALAAWRWW